MCLEDSEGPWVFTGALGTVKAVAEGFTAAIEAQRRLRAIMSTNEPSNDNEFYGNFSADGTC